MERTKYFLTLIFLLLSLLIFCQNNANIYESYITDDMDKWKTVMDSIQKKAKKTNETKLNLLNYQYGYISYCITEDKDSQAEKYIEKANKLIEQLEQNKYKLSVLYAYKAALIGFKIGLSPYKAPFMGPKSSKYAQTSVEINPNNTLGYIQLGNIAYHKPSIFGGSKSEAIKHYIHALKLMEKEPKKLKNNWNYLNLLVSIIKTYISQEEFLSAKQYCIKALKFEPRFNWVKKQLYPQVLKQLEDE